MLRIVTKRILTSVLICALLCSSSISVFAESMDSDIDSLTTVTDETSNDVTDKVDTDEVSDITEDSVSKETMADDTEPDSSDVFAISNEIEPVAVPLSAFVQTVGYSDEIRLQIQNLSDDPAATLDQELVTVMMPDDQKHTGITVDCGSVWVSQGGTYEFLMQLAPMTNIRESTQRYRVEITTVVENSVITDTSVIYRDDLTGNVVDKPVFQILSNQVPTQNQKYLLQAGRYLSNMTLDEKVGQVFMSPYTSTGANSVTNLIDQYQPGSLILFKYDVEKHTPATLTKQLSDLQDRANTGMMIAVDEEGGKVTRVSSVPGFRDGGAFPAPQDLKIADDHVASMVQVKADTKEKADLLTALGFNMNLAPVADVSGPSGYIYARTYGGDGVENATYTETVVREAKKNGLGTCLKHFPGYGGTSSNTHNGFAINDLTETDFWTNDLLPFVSGIAAGTDMVLVTHNIINYLDTVNPASLSPAVYSLLKDDLGFQGLVITDDLGMKAITDFTGSDSPTVLALKAGADMVCTPNIVSEYPKVKAAISNGTLSEERLNDAVLKILYWKAEQGLLKVSDVEAGFYDTSGTKVAQGSFDDMWNRAVTAGAGTVRLYKDIERTTAVSTGMANITLDLYGFTLFNKGAASSELFWVNTGGFLTITDSYGSLFEEQKEMSGRFHQYSYTDGVLTLGIKGDTTYQTIDFKNSTVGRIECSGSNRAIVMNGGILNFQKGIIANGNDGVVTFSTKNGASGGAFRLTGGAIIDCHSSWNGGAFNFPAGSDSTKIELTAGYLVNNTAKNNGGAIFTNGDVNISGTAWIIGNKAKNGGGVFVQQTKTATIYGNALLAYNEATNESGAVSIGSGLQIHEYATIIGNKAGVGGASYVTQAVNYITGGVRIFDNNANTGPDLYLLSGEKFFLKRNDTPVGLEKTAKIAISHANIPNHSAVPIVSSYKEAWGSDEDDIVSKWPDYILDCFICSDSNYLAVYEYRESSGTFSKLVTGIWFKQMASVDLSWGLFLDEVFQADTAVVRYTSNNQRILFTRVVRKLQKYGFDPEHLDQYDATYFGFSTSDGKVFVFDGTIQYDGDYKILLDTDKVLDQCKLLYFGKSVAPGTYTYEETKSMGTFRSVDVQDVYSKVWANNDGDSSFQYVPDGMSLTLKLSVHDESWIWSDRRTPDSSYDVTFTPSASHTQVALSNIHSSVIISNGDNDDVMYKAQYYGYVYPVDLSDTLAANKIPVIDTSGGVLPENTESQPLRYLTVNEADGNRILRKRQLMQLYTDSSYVYSLNPKLSHIDRLSNDIGYELSAIWVLKAGRSPISIDEADFDVYRLEDFPEFTSLHQLHLTTRPDKVSNDTILIKSGTVVRFVYKPVKSEQIKYVNFYDYDISDGKVYGISDYNETSFSKLTELKTSQQETFYYVGANTYESGINSAENYHSVGSKLAFGNSNTGVRHKDETWNNLKINQYNRSPNVYKGCVFGLVTGVGGNDLTGYYPIYAPGVSAPYLFNYGSATGKTTYRDVPLSYEKQGDSYTLMGVGNTIAQNLDQFSHPVTGSTVYTNIWSNNFWPMDSFPSYGTDGHDLKFGDYTKRDRRVFQNRHSSGDLYWIPFAPSDDGLDHNAYFGMNFSIEFTIPEGYRGPLEYAFFGDDDMWVFLDDQLIIDIGGVHSSVGEYANLWDYLDGTDDGGTTHRLTIFFTERGASGSTCWMTFNLPQVKFASDEQTDDDGSLELTKQVTGLADPSTTYDFTVELFDAAGNVPKDDFTYKRLDPNGNIIGYGLIENGKASFSIRDGGKLVIPYIKDGLRYKITEAVYDCNTSFHSRLGTVESSSKGTVTEGTISKGETVYLTCTNQFASGSFMPDAGTDDLLWYVYMGSWLVFMSVPLLFTLYWYRRKRMG